MSCRKITSRFLQLNSWLPVIVTIILALVYGMWMQSLAAQDSNQAKWTATGSLSASRAYHTATLLPNGQVLIAGGFNGSEDIASSELYTPDEGVFVPAANMATGRTNHSATLLSNGRVLVVGGQFHGRTLASAELYNPATGAWTDTGSLHIARAYHTATLLADGQVLVVGGARLASPPLFPQGAPLGSALDIAELYNPATSKWTVVDNLHAARYLHTATLLKNGEVLVTGGLGAKGPGNASPDDEDSFPGAKMMRLNGPANVEASAELYNPATRTWTVTGSLPTPVFAHTASLLPNGQVLVAGGKPTFESDAACAELYNPANGTWMPTASLHAARNAHTATLLSNGQIFVLGGANSSGVLTSTELYIPSTGTWETAAGLNTGRSLQTATLLPKDQILVTGGCYALGSPAFVQASAEVYGSVAAVAQESPRTPALAERVQSYPAGSDRETHHLVRLATCLVMLTSCVVILTGCVVTLLIVWLVFVLIRRSRK